MTNVKIILFDLDDTVLDFHRSEKEAISETLREIGIEPTEEISTLYSGINQSLWELLEKKEIAKNRLVIRRFEILFEKLGVERDAKETQRMYENILSGKAFVLPDAEKTLGLLKEKFRLFATSNGTEKVQESRVALSGIDKYFEKIFISGRIGYEKPDRRFFEKCFSMIDGFEREKTVIVGDSLSSDMRGGNSCGIRTVFLNRKGKSIPDDVKIDATVKTLSALPALFGIK